MKSLKRNSSGTVLISGSNSSVGRNHRGRISPATAKKGVVATVVLILLLTVLEFPAPIGFETRPQSDVSPFWLAFFLLILITEVAAIPAVYRLGRLGAGLGLLAAFLNILQIVADQAHLMQPEIATFGYSVLEGTVGIASLALAYFSWTLLQARGSHDSYRGVSKQ